MTEFRIWKVMIIIGIIFILIGFFLFLFERKLQPFRLPGDLIIRKGNFEFYFPITTMILVSLLISVIVNLIFRK